MATLYFKMKQRIILDWKDSVSFEDFYERCIQSFYSNIRSIPLSSIMSFVSQINSSKQILLSFSGLEANCPRYVYNIYQKTSANIYRGTDACMIFRESIYNSQILFRGSYNNIGFSIIHKYTRFINASFPENKKTTKKLIESIAKDIYKSVQREFISSTVVVEKVTAKKISQYTFLLTNKISFNKYDFIVFHLYLSISDKTKNKLVITKFLAL